MSIGQFISNITAKDDSPQSVQWRFPSVIAGLVASVAAVAGLAFSTMTAGVATFVGAIGASLILGGVSGYGIISATAAIIAFGVSFAAPGAWYGPAVIIY